MKLGELEFTSDDADTEVDVGVAFQPHETDYQPAITIERANQLLRERLERCRRVYQRASETVWYDLGSRKKFENRKTGKGTWRFTGIVVCSEVIE